MDRRERGVRGGGTNGEGLNRGAHTGRNYSLGWRLVRGGSGGDGGSFELSFEARRRESANDDTPPEHEVGLRLSAPSMTQHSETA